MLVKYRNGTSEYFPLDEVGNFHTGRGVAVSRFDTFLKRENGMVYPMQNGRVVYGEQLTPNIVALKNGLKYQIQELQDLYTLLQVGGTFTSIMGAYGLGANTSRLPSMLSSDPRLRGFRAGHCRAYKVKQPTTVTTKTTGVDRLAGEMQGLKGGGPKKITVEGVDIAHVQVIRQGKILAVSRYSTQRVNADERAWPGDESRFRRRGRSSGARQRHETGNHQRRQDNQPELARAPGISGLRQNPNRHGRWWI